MTHVDRREFLGWSALAAAGLFVDGLFTSAWAQDVRGLPMTAAVPITPMYKAHRNLFIRFT